MPPCRSLPGVMSTGNLSALVAYAAVPWFVHLLRVAVGIGTPDPAAAATDLVEGVIPLGGRERVRRTALLLIVTALGHRNGARDRHRLRRHGGRARPVDADRRRRRSHRGVDDRSRGAGGRRWVAAQPAVGDDVVVGRPHRSAAGGTERSGTGRHGGHGDRWGAIRVARDRPVPPGPGRTRGVAGLAADVGGAGSRPRRGVPRAGRAAGSRRIAVHDPGRRAAPGAGGAGAGAVGGVGGRRLLRRRHRTHVGLASTTRPAVDRRGHRRADAGRVHGVGRLVVPATRRCGRAGRG